MTATTVTGWLLDTHALLWMLHGDKRLSKPAAHAIAGKIPLYHSSASFWEIAIKLSGKGFDFEIPDDWNQLYPDELKRIGIPLLSPTIDDQRTRRPDWDSSIPGSQGSDRIGNLLEDDGFN